MTPDNVRHLIELGTLVAMLVATIALTFLLCNKVSADEFLQVAPIAVAAIVGVCKMWALGKNNQRPKDE